MSCPHQSIAVWSEYCGFYQLRKTRLRNQCYHGEGIPNQTESFRKDRCFLPQYPAFCMSENTNYCLRGPDGEVVGFQLDANELGHEIYDLLDWADKHFSSRVVEQVDGRVYIYSEPARETMSAGEVRAEPFSITSNGQGDSSGGDSPAGGLGGNGGGNGPGGNVPAGDPSSGSGDGTVVQPPSR